MDVLGLGLLFLLYYSSRLLFATPMVDTFKFCGMSGFFAWVYSPQRRLFENKVVHPLSYQFTIDPTFCPQLHGTRPRIKLKSLAWARHHKERLLFPPKVYAKHVANVRDWKQAATQHKWGGNWDELPYKKGDGTLQNGTHKNTILIPIRSVMASIFLFDTGSPSIFSF